MIPMSSGPWVTLFGSVFPTSAEALAARSKFAWGFFLIFLQCLILVGNAILTQYIFNENELESPFIMSYFGISTMTIMLPVHFLMERRRDATLAKEAKAEAVLEAPSFDSFADDLQRYKNYSDLVDIAARRAMGLVNDHDRRWNHRKHLTAALLITPAMYLADWAFNAALLSTSIASATVLVSVQSIFVYVLAVVLSLEFYSNWKLLGVMAAVAGTALTAIHDDNSDNSADQGYSYSDVITYTYNATIPPDEFEFPTTSTWGDTLAVLAATAYATYTIQVRLFCPENEELYSMHLLLGYIGALSLIPLAPVAIWLFITEQIRMSRWTLFLVLLKGVFDFLITDYLLFRSIILCGATVATVGLGMSIPFAFLGDLLMGKTGIFSLYSTVGAMSCALGFLIVNLAPNTEKNVKQDDNGIDDSYSSKEVPILQSELVMI